MWPFDRSVRLARVRIVRIDIRARHRAIHGDPTLSNRMFVLIEQRNVISSGSNVPSSPQKEEIDRLPRNRSISRVDRRAVNRHQTSRSRLFVLLERRDRIVNGEVLISPATDKQRRSNRVTATPVLNDHEAICKRTHRVTQGICKIRGLQSKQQKQTQYNNQQVLEPCWGCNYSDLRSERDKTNNTTDQSTM